MKTDFFYLQIALAVAAILFFLFGCSRPLVQQELAQSARETYNAGHAFTRGYTENMAIDSFFIRITDTLTLYQYYGVTKRIHDTVTVRDTVYETKTDSVYVSIVERQELSFWEKLKLLATGALLGIAVYWIGRKFV